MCKDPPGYSNVARGPRLAFGFFGKSVRAELGTGTLQLGVFGAVGVMASSNRRLSTASDDSIIAYNRSAIAYIGLSGIIL